MNKDKQKRNLHPCRMHDKSFITVGMRLSARNSSIWVCLFLQKASTSESTSTELQMYKQHGRTSTWPTKYSSSNYHSWKCDVKYLYIYLATSAKGGVCIQCPSTHKHFLFVRTFLLWVTSAEVSYHRRNTHVWVFGLKYNGGGGGLSHKAENCHSRTGVGHRALGKQC